MTKAKDRPPLNLSALTSDYASPMPEAEQRSSKVVPAKNPLPESITRQLPVDAEDLRCLGFKVPASFRKRSKQRAVAADLHQVELLAEALDAWEEKRGLKS